MFLPRSVARSRRSGKSSAAAAHPRERREEDGSARNTVTVVDLRAQAPSKEEEEEKVWVKQSSQKTTDKQEEKEEEEEEVVSYSKQQRWPLPGEPVCVVCGRYGAYIVDKTGKDVCSLECKAKQLVREGVPSATPGTRGEGDTGMSQQGDGGEGCLSVEQVSQWRREMDVHVRGNAIPHPILQTSQLQMCSKLEENLQLTGYNHLTPVQMQVIPAVLTGRDVLVCSATGSGKTLSFLLPIVHSLTTSPSPSPAVLILSPTRELSLQLEEQAKQLMRGLPDMRTAVLIGGVPLPQQLHRLKSSIQVLVGTPARVKEIIENHAVSLDLSRVKQLVLDEVDSLLQMGFEEQVHAIVESLPRSRQNLMFSATIPPKIEKLASEMLNDPLFISFGEPSAPSSGIRHTVLWVEEPAKKQRLFSFLKDKELFKPPAIVFVSSKKGSLLLADAINKVCDVSAVCLHGDMAQDRRSSILTGFLEGRYELVVSTGVLARGLVLPDVHQVFNFDMPLSVEEFVHQIGRAGRLGSLGWAITFINNENKGVFCDLVEMLEPLGVQLPSQLLHSPTLAQQRERRKRRQTEDLSAEKKGRRDFYNRESLLELVKGKPWKKKR